MTSKTAPFHFGPIRVYYEDTDMAGIVYYANYLKYIERARSEWVRDLGVDQNELRDAGIVFVVRRVEAEYHRPGHFDDLLDVYTHVETARGARLIVLQEIKRGDELLFSAKVTVTCVNASGRVTRLPASIRPHPA
ncbi:MAG: tol-pal system-associated acyl-CoA thioesterase [Pseudomonadota bacterium]